MQNGYLEKKSNKIKLNIGCGRDYRKGWKNVDASREVKADEYYDIRNGIKEEENSCIEIYCSGVLEQILENEKFLFVMNELWRVLDPNGIATIVVPSSRYAIAFRDPFDCRHFIEETWDYIDYNKKYYHLYGSVYGFKPWIVLEKTTNLRGIMTIVMRPLK